MNDKGEIKLKYWVVAIFVPIIISVSGAFITIRVTEANTKIEIEHIKKDMFEFQSNKANLEMVLMLKENIDDNRTTLIRIEKKLDTHIKENNHDFQEILKLLR